MANTARELVDAETRERRSVRLQRILSGGLDGAVRRMGGELVGLSIKTENGDCLITLRLAMPAGRMVAFVGGFDMAECFLKAYREANSDKLKLKPDRYAR